MLLRQMKLFWVREQSNYYIEEFARMLRGLLGEPRDDFRGQGR